MRKITLILTLLCAISVNTRAQDFRSQLRQIANDLAKEIEAKGKKRVVSASFLDLKNQETDLGRYMSDKFSIGLASSSLEITDRSQLAQLLLDNKLGADRILDPKTIPTLGKITGAEVIIIGNYTALDNTVDITVKAIDLERGLRIAVAEGTVARTPEINRLLSEVSSPDDLNRPVNPKKPLDSKLPKPPTDCGTKYKCVICAMNNSSMPIEVKRNHLVGAGGIDDDHKDLFIYTGETKCWQNVWIGNNNDYFKFTVNFFQNEARVKQELVNARACEVKLLTFNK